MSTSTSATHVFSPVVFQKHRTRTQTHKRLGSSSSSQGLGSIVSSASASGIDTAHARIRTAASTFPPTSTSETRSDDSTRTYLNGHDHYDHESANTKRAKGISPSGSGSKLWKRRGKRVKFETPSAYAYVFKVIFVACLVLFVHALSGFGAQVVPLEGEHQLHQQHQQFRNQLQKKHDTGIGIGVQEPSRQVRFHRFSSGSGSSERLAQKHVHDHDHLAVDPDGHYTYTYSVAALTDREDDKGEAYTYRWRWGGKGSHPNSDVNYTSVDVDLAVGNGNVDTLAVSGGDAQNVPMATTVEEIRGAALNLERKDALDVHNTPPPSAPSATAVITSANVNGDVYTSTGTVTGTNAPPHDHDVENPNSKNDDAKFAEAGEGGEGGEHHNAFEMDLSPFFDIDGPVYPMRVHLPASLSSSVPEEQNRVYRRGRWRGRHAPAPAPRDRGHTHGAV